MGKFGSKQLGKFADGYLEHDDPKLNKCPNCGALTDGDKCPICGTFIPFEMRAGHREQSVKNVRYCEYCGTENNPKTKRCSMCGRKRRSGHRIALIIESIIILIETAFIAYLFVIGAQKYYNKPIQQTVSATPDLTQFKQNCEEIEYTALARNPNSYIDRKVKFTGQVVQALEQDGAYFVLMNVVDNGYGYWDGLIGAWVQAKSNGDRILEDDIITVYGICRGLYTYETIMGAENSVPLLNVLCYDLAEQ